MPAVDQPWMVFFLLAAGHGLFLSSFLAFKSGRSHPSARYLSLLILLFSLSLLYYLAYWTGMVREISPYWGVVLALPTLYGPLIFAFFSELRLRRILIWIHTIPFWLHLGYLFGYYLQQSTAVSSLWFSILGVRVFILLQNLSLMAYAWWVLKDAYKLKPSRGNAIVVIGWCFAGFVLSYCSYYALVFTTGLEAIHDYYISLSMTIFMYVLGYLSHSSKIMRALSGKFRTYHKPGLSRSMIDNFKPRLLEIMQSEKPYLNGNLKMRELAETLNMTSHQLSELINLEFGINFSEFLNHYRVLEARRLLLKEPRVMDAGYKSGFNNKTSFSQIFKRHTGLTPSQYRDSKVSISGNH